MSVDLAAVSPKNVKRAAALNREGVGLNGKERFEPAIEKFAEALAVHPGNLLARYNLSCAYNRSGKSALGIAVLQQFRKAATSGTCSMCSGRLLRARNDSDWASEKANPVFMQVTQLSAEQAGTLVLQGFNHRNMKALAPMLSDEHPVTFSKTSLSCRADGQDCLSGAKTNQRGTRAVRDWTKAFGQLPTAKIGGLRWQQASSFVCEAPSDDGSESCCQVDSGKPTTLGVHLSLLSFCFDSSVSRLSTITIHSTALLKRWKASPAEEACEDKDDGSQKGCVAYQNCLQDLATLKHETACPEVNGQSPNEECDFMEGQLGEEYFAGQCFDD
ncbi:MAG: hypothetical protein GY811_11505 [Myxococcales bacterium]|nr:hypothetical protein [Myxococcales bacterium]